MTTIPQRLRDIARSVHEMEYGQPGALADSLRTIAAELESPAADAVSAAVVAEYLYGHPRSKAVEWAKEDKFDSCYRQAEKICELLKISKLQARINELEARQWQPLTDEDRTRAFQSLPDMLEGFMKTWGWLHFAKAVEAICREKNAHPDTSKEQP